MDSILSWLQSHQDVIIDSAQNVLLALVLLYVGVKVSGYISRFIASILEKRAKDAAIVSFIRSLLKAILIVCFAVAALSQIGVETTTFVAVLGAAGLAIGLSLQGSLSNFASGILISVFRPFKAGDFVDIGGTLGTVQNIDIFFTKIHTPDNKVVVVPNSKVTSQDIVNFSVNDTRRLEWIFGISYDADIKLAKELIEQALQAHPNVLQEPTTLVGVDALADSSVNLLVRAWVKSEHFLSVRLEITETVKTLFDEHNVGIPYQTLDINVISNSKESA